MPLMVEPLVMQPNGIDLEDMVDGDLEKILLWCGRQLSWAPKSSRLTPAMT